MKGFPGVVNTFYYLAFVAILAWASGIEKDQTRKSGPAPASEAKGTAQIDTAISVAKDPVHPRVQTN